MFKYALTAKLARYSLGEMRRLLILLVAAQVAMLPAPAYAADAAWEPWRTIKGVFDVDGPRTDGTLIIDAAGLLYLVDPAGTVTPFAQGLGGYREDAGPESYLAMSPGGTVSAAGCSFVPDETFLLRLRVPIGITRVSASGDASGSFANLTGVTTLSGMVFDTTGEFDHRLLVTGSSSGKTVIFAIDCNGIVKVITRSAPALEGGLAVAPSSFAPFGGALIATDERSGKIYAIRQNGAVSTVARPKLPTGGDIGVETVGFVPTGFMDRGGFVYYADRVSPKNPHPGTDSLLRLSSAQLAAAGVQDGDLISATEGGGTVVAVRCAPLCKVIPVVSKATKAHGEGHFAFAMNAAPSKPPTTTPTAIPASSGSNRTSSLVTAGVGIAIAIAVLVALLAGVLIVRRRRRP